MNLENLGWLYLKRGSGSAELLLKPALTRSGLGKITINGADVINAHQLFRFAGIGQCANWNPHQCCQVLENANLKAVFSLIGVTKTCFTNMAKTGVRSVFCLVNWLNKDMILKRGYEGQKL